jgi:hypothetical protein
MPILTTNEQAVFKNLNPRETAFVKAYWGINRQAVYDASKAIRETGYAGARANQAGYKMMQRPSVKQAFELIEKLQDDARNRVEQERVQRLELEREEYVQKLLGRIRRG